MGSRNSSLSPALGVYTVAEQDPGPNYDLTGVDCEGGNATINGGKVTLDMNTPGLTAHCTFTNTQRSTVVVRKETLPDGDPQAFAYAVTGPAGAVPIPPLADGQTATIAYAKPGRWTLEEAVPSDWDLTDITCTSARGTSTYTPDLANDKATLDVAPGDTLSCVFNNSKHEHITIKKVTVPAGGTGFSFNNGAFTLDDGGIHTVNLNPGATYVATEDAPTLSAYALTDISCVDNQGGTSYQIDLSSRRVSFSGAAGLAASCTYTNTLLGAIVIEKVTQPALGDVFGFTDTISSPGSFSLSNGESKSFTNVAPGRYLVSEALPGGDVQLANIVCNDGSSATPSIANIAERAATINVDPGETVTCTYTNVRNDTVVIQKFTRPAGDGLTDFSFSSNLPGAGAFTLKDGNVRLVTGVTPGQTYTVAEADPTPGYDLVDVTCYDTDTGQVIQGDLSTRAASFTPQPGHTVYCSFINEKRGKIVVEKVVEPSPNSATFDFITDAGSPSSFTLGDGATQEFIELKPGRYTVEELASAPAYRLGSVTCTDSIGNGLASQGDAANRQAIVNLDPGETVTCRFLNAQNNTVIIQKFTDPPGDTQTTFAFTTNLPGGAFSLKDGEFHVVKNVPSSQLYTVTEGDPRPGYDLTALACFDTFTGAVVDGDHATRSITFTPQPGHVIYCAFGNTRRGSVTIAKQTTPASSASFTFLMTGPGGPYQRSVVAGSQQTIDNLLPGVYTVRESDPALAGYDLGSIQCTVSGSGGNLATVDLGLRTATIHLDPGENVTCTFQNVKRGSLTVVKQTVGGEGTFDFASQTLTPTDIQPGDFGQHRVTQLRRPGAGDLRRDGDDAGWLGSDQRNVQ